jgi:hypothetical protein
MRPVKERAQILEPVSTKITRAPNSLPKNETGTAMAGPVLKIASGRTFNSILIDRIVARKVR